jgi:ABC-type nitrate/sulfonate/bicarbonate transport system ATPase subunit
VALAGPAASSVTVRGLDAGYDGRQGHVPVLAGVELALSPGECLVVVGESGCGKSTLLHLLSGLIAPEAGEVVVDGRAVAAADFAGDGLPGCSSGHAAYMFQRDLLLPWKSVLANTMFAAEVARDAHRSDRGRRPRPRGVGRPDRVGLEERARTILCEFGLAAALDTLPRELSGGMRQRVALARTLVLGRGLVLLDEPFGSLDAFTRAELQGWLLDVMEAHPATWVLVTHDVREAVLLGDRVAVLAGRPARLEGWVPVPLDRTARRRLAAPEAADHAVTPFTRRIHSLLAQGRIT